MENCLKPICLIIIAAWSFQVKGQDKPNPIITAVPFLNVAPDARSGGLGDGGVAFSNDANVTFWNPSLMVFLPDSYNVSFSYSPWYHQTIPHSYFVDGAFVAKVSENDALGFSLRDLQLGSIPLFDSNINALGTFQPNEIAADLSYAHKFSPTFSMALSARYIHSDISNNLVVQGVQTGSINSIAADVSLTYNSIPDIHEISTFSFGADISNIGPKVSYTTVGQKYFLPINLRFGPAFRFPIGDKSHILFALDINKLLVPTPPIRSNTGVIIQGQDDNRSVVSGMFGSFGDAPGGASEEFQEVYGSSGVEILFNNQIAIRAGYFYESPNKGNRQYVTTGAGLNLKLFDVSFSYISASQIDSPFANSMRLSILFHWDAPKQISYPK